MGGIVDLRTIETALASRLTQRVIDIALLVFCAAGVAYLFFKIYSLGAKPGYDFKYVWLAGKQWVNGVNPYGSAYAAEGALTFTETHPPDYWVYPPSWFIFAAPLGLTGPGPAAVAFNLVSAVLMVVANWLIVAAMAPLQLLAAQNRRSARFVAALLRSDRNVFLLLTGAMCILQATANSLSAGQTSIFMYFGVALVFFGLGKSNQAALIAGLAIALLKPQIGGPIVAALLITPAHWGTLVKAAVASLLLCIPATIVAPTSLLDWVNNLMVYDDFTTANLPVAMTGIRNVIWDLSSTNLSNTASLAFTLVVTAAAGFALKTRNMKWPHLSDDSGLAMSRILIAVAATAALAPLHTYDLVIVGALLIPILIAPLELLALGAFGAALLWRAGDVALVTGFYNHGTLHFEGSRLATLGALMMLAAVFLTLRNSRSAKSAGIAPSSSAH